MYPEDIGGQYECTVTVEEFRVLKKAEYQVVVRIKFFSTATRSIANTSWSVWRPFNMFRTLDSQLRKRNYAHMKGIKFPRLHRGRTLLRTNLNTAFLENRRKDLDTYMSIVTRLSAITAFHTASIQSQSMKTFVGFVNGFGQNGTYQPSTSAGETRSAFDRPHPSTSSVSMVDNYRWSGTGFLNSSFSQSGGNNTSCYSTNNNRTSMSFGSRPLSHSTFSIPQVNRTSLASANSRNSLMSISPPIALNPIVEAQRAKMETQLANMGLMGVGMPPDGSCLLHCLIYEMFPLKCLAEYPAYMNVVNVGSADGMAPRRIEAAAVLRHKLMDYALEHVEKLSSFLMQPIDELTKKYSTFRNVSDEQGTIAELYAAASMFNIEILLITNDPSFKIDPVLPVSNLPNIRPGELRSITLGYMIPQSNASGHYICTREKYGAHIGPINSFTGGSYRGSIKIDQPKTNRCSVKLLSTRKFEQGTQQRVE